MTTLGVYRVLRVKFVKFSPNVSTLNLVVNFALRDVVKSLQSLIRHIVYKSLIVSEQ